MDRPIPQPGHQVNPNESSGQRLKECEVSAPKVYKPKRAIVHKINSRIPELITFMSINIRIECQL